jgi:hypothetical protein
LIKNLTIDFDSRNFENPATHKFYAGLQALALNEQEPEPVQDLLEPDYEGLKRFQPVLDKFKHAFFDGNSSDSQISQTSKPSARGVKRPRAAIEKKIPDVVHEVHNFNQEHSSDEEVKEPTSKKRRIGKGSLDK